MPHSSAETGGVSFGEQLDQSGRLTGDDVVGGEGRGLVPPIEVLGIFREQRV